MTHHLQADCQELGSAAEPYARQSSWVWATFLVCWCFLQNYSSLRWVSYVDCQHDLPAFAAQYHVCGAVAAECRRLLSIDILLQCALQQTCCCCRQSMGRMDPRPFHRPCSAYYATVSVTFKCLCSVLFLFMYLWTFCVIVLALINVAVFENAVDSE